MHKKTRLSLGVVGVAAAVGAVLVPATNAFATPTIGTVNIASPEPSGFGLQNGDVVSVSGSGFTPSTQVGITECTAVLPANCNTSDFSKIVLTSTDASGNLPATNFTVFTGDINGTACGAGSTCFVSVGDVATTGNTTAGASQVVFDNLQVSPRTNLIDGQVLNLSGANFAPNATVYIGECHDSNPLNAATACGTPKQVTADINGAFSTTFPVKTGTIGDGHCNPGETCFVGATDNPLDPGTADLGGAVVKFKSFTKKTVTVTASSTDTTVKPGQKFHIKGRTKVGTAGVNNLTVKLYRKAHSATSYSFVSKQTTRTINGVKGSYNFTQYGQKHNEDYKVVHPKQTIGLNIYLADTSPIIHEKRV